ncbi:asparagine synthetase B, partial [Candidatus Woesearchaeota archaeon CG08_land_8_20_14_0_20_43_7]
MCGICGFSGDDKALVMKMADAIVHRGPDQEGFYSDKYFSLAHKRLSIIDLSSRGKQPMHNEDGSIIVVYNGEIYNHAKLREELEKKGHRFMSETDTEVIVHAYEQYGSSCVNHFRGIFAFAIYDRNKKQLFLARDHIGVKPLYYHYDGKDIIFASEIKSILLHPSVRRNICKRVVNDYLSFRYIPGEDT